MEYTTFQQQREVELAEKSLKHSKKCSLCGILKDRSLFPIRDYRNRDVKMDWCINCRRQRWARRRILKDKKLYHTNQRFRRQRRAYHILRYAVRVGKIVRQPCRDCGSRGRVHGHHPDYTKPLLVVWLCSPCHAAEHKRLRKGGLAFPDALVSSPPQPILSRG